VEKGGEGKYQGSKFTYSLNYLEVPLLLKRITGSVLVIISGDRIRKKS
jgi:hypothetical protein